MYFYKHMKFRNQSRTCLTVYDFEAHSILSLSLTFQGARLLVRYRKNLTPMWLRKMNLFSVISIDLKIKLRENIALFL